MKQYNKSEYLITRSIWILLICFFKMFPFNFLAKYQQIIGFPGWPKGNIGKECSDTPILYAI